MGQFWIPEKSLYPIVQKFEDTLLGLGKTEGLHLHDYNMRNMNSGQHVVWTLRAGFKGGPRFFLGRAEKTREDITDRTETTHPCVTSLMRIHSPLLTADWRGSVFLPHSLTKSISNTLERVGHCPNVNPPEQYKFRNKSNERKVCT